jgi:hypothetical protein
MRSSARIILALALTLGVAACNKASEEECEAACLHYSKLGLAEEQDLALGSAELEQAWAAWREREELEVGLAHCTQICQGQASSGQTVCILEAESLEQADSCSGVSRARSIEEED